MNELLVAGPVGVEPCVYRAQCNGRKCCDHPGRAEISRLWLWDRGVRWVPLAVLRQVCAHPSRVKARMWLSLEKRKEHLTNQKACVLAVVLLLISSVTLVRFFRISGPVSHFWKRKNAHWPSWSTE